MITESRALFLWIVSSINPPRINLAICLTLQDVKWEFKMFKTLSASALIVAMATASTAGSLTDPIVEEASEGVFVPAPSSGIGLPVVLGAVAAIAVVAAIAANDDDDAVVSHPAD